MSFVFLKTQHRTLRMKGTNSANIYAHALLLNQTSMSSPTGFNRTTQRSQGKYMCKHLQKQGLNKEELLFKYFIVCYHSVAALVILLGVSWYLFFLKP